MIRVFQRVLLSLFLSGLCLVARSEAINPQTGVGKCIWSSEIHDRQECRFVRSFEIPRGARVESALLRITADNSYQLFLDGQPVGQGGDWRVLIEYDVRLLLSPGEHVIAVSALNDFDVAGMVFGLRVRLNDGSLIEIASDDSWQIAPGNFDSWETFPHRVRSLWPHATIQPDMRQDATPQVYHAPVSKPRQLAFWERKGFQFSMIAVAALSFATGIFLTSRLILKSQMEKVVRRERSRIAIDLHDNLGGGLTQLVLLGETSRRNLPAESEISEALGKLCQQSRDLMQGMNETVWLINSERDTLQDFSSYISRYAEKFFKDTTVRCLFDIEPDLPELHCDIGVRRNLFLAVKEALNNVLRHARATQMNLIIRRLRNELCVSIRDNGRGFDPASTSSGNGLNNMTQRATEAGGRVTIFSQPGEGSTLTFYIPLQSASGFRLARRIG